MVGCGEGGFLCLDLPGTEAVLSKLVWKGDGALGTAGWALNDWVKALVEVGP